MAFKAGDRIRCIDSDYGLNVQKGSEYTVKKDGPPIVVCEASGGFYPWRFELVEPLELEVGATVTIGDGKDEWEVVYVGLGTQVRRGPIFLNTDKKNLTVVKAKPEPPKPDYYVNCKGERPQDGDVFTTGPNVTAWVQDGFYFYANQYRLDERFSLTSPTASHRIGGPAPRTLLARADKPYTGNV